LVAVMLMAEHAPRWGCIFAHFGRRRGSLRNI
jgi:hypothetical protein